LTKKNQSTQVVSTSVEKSKQHRRQTTANNTTGTTGNAGNTDNSRNNSQIAQIPGAPTALISTVSTNTIITDNVNSLQALIAPYLITNRATDGYYRLLIQNKQTDSYIGLRQLFDAFQVKPPAALLRDLNDEATFLYIQIEGKIVLVLLLKLRMRLILFKL